ncbi:MAG: VOC family protein [Thermoplasmata archaeon]|nr:VOC family protein [Thermoplasmata archaeon]
MPKSILEPRVTLVTLGVKDLPRSIRFYRDVVGWTTSAAETDPVAFFPLRGIVLGRFGERSLAADAKTRPRTGGFRGVTLAYNARSRAAVDRIFASLSERGVRIVKRPQVADWGGYSGYFADPDGHLWEVAHNSFWKLDRGGRALVT